MAHDTIRKYPEETPFKLLDNDSEGYIHLQCPKCQADLTIDPFSATGTRKLTDVSKKRFAHLGGIVFIILLVVAIGYFFYGKNGQ